MSKVWLITGASRGLGRAFTEEALKAGHRVLATTRNSKTADGFTYLDPAQFHEYFASDVPAERAAFHGAIAGSTRLRI